MSTVPQRLGKYELRRSLGRGNVGEVWKGYDLQLRRDVAIKIIHSDLQADPNLLAHFMEAGQAVASLHHTNIVQVHETNIARPTEANNTAAYIVMEYIEGQTLVDYMNNTSRKGKFPSIAEIMYLFTSLGVAIDYAHQKGIVHGDIKPSNILLDQHNKQQFEAGEPMLTDFGLARLLGNTASIGTPLYMSPEQAKGYPANNRSDIYSLGVILYELCTGVQPFRDESSVAVLMQHINALPTPPTLINHNIPPALSEVILRAMAKDTATRFSMASLLATAIADACSIQQHGTTRQERISEEDHLSEGQQSSILGVSQPLPRISRPLPATSGPLPIVTGNHYAAKPPQVMPTPTNSIPLSTVTNTTPTSTAKFPSMPVPLTPALPLQPPEPPVAPQQPASFAPQPSVALQPYISQPGRKMRLRSSDTPIYLVIGVLVLVLLVIGGAIGASLLNARNSAGSTAAGHIFFQDDALGHADELHINIQNVSAPPQGKTYFAWLQDSGNHMLPLGALTFQNGSISYIYEGDGKQTNLLSIVQGVTVTLEDTTNTAGIPHGNTVYQAKVDRASFQYIKNILYQTPGFPATDGVAVGLYDTIKSMNDKTGSIADSIQRTLDYELVKRQATRVIEMVDGHDYARNSGDLPAQYPSYIDSKAGIISSPTQPGYLDTLATQLDKIKQVAGGNQTLLQHVQNVQNAIADLRDWVQEIRTYDVKILKAPRFDDPTIVDAALQLKQITSDAYTGRVVPPAEAAQPTLGSAGALQAYNECLFMASLDLKAV